MRSVFLAFLLVLLPSVAYANGRFPQSNAVFFAPSEDSAVVLRTTFGLLLSSDRGATWDWVCEPAVGLVGVEDPMLAITADNSLLATTFQGLSLSHDHACSWSFASGPLSGLVFVDSATRPGAVVAFSSSFVGQDSDGGLDYATMLFETTDQGQTFTALGPALDPLVLGRTVDVTQTDADRIYVSGIRSPGKTGIGAFLTSRDHGKTFEENDVPFVPNETGLFIAGVDPTNADRVYVRTAGESPDVPSRLLVTDDAGKTFRVIYTGIAALQGFALSDDGTKIWTGGPKDGLLMANASDDKFTSRSSIQVGCLKVDRGELWACSSEVSGFVLGVSQDDGSTFTPKLHFCDVKGPLACAAGTSTANACGGTAWPNQEVTLGCVDAGEGDAGAADAGAAPAHFEPGGCASGGSPGAAALPLFAVLIAALVRRRQRLDSTASSR